jgi:nucleotide-binding universal stress UspA family protein
MSDDASAAPLRNSDSTVDNSPRVIVVGLDGSASGWDAFAWAAGAAGRSDRQLVAVHVVPLTEPAAMFAVPFDDAGIEAARQEIAAELKTEAERRAQEAGVPMRFVVEHGEVTHAVTEIARALHADLVVVGRSTKTRHRLAGSLSQRLTRRQDAPVVVVVP